MKRLWRWVAVVAIMAILVLPMPLAERFTSPTQDGQYITNPLRSYRFVIAAASARNTAVLGRSGLALDRARDLLSSSGQTVVKVELLFFPEPLDYTHRTRSGLKLAARVPGPFVWEVWARSGDAAASDQPEVLALLDYQTGEVLASQVPKD